MRNKIAFFLSSALILLAASGCQKMDKPELGEYATDDNQTLLPGNLRFFTSFNSTDGPSARWNAKDSISGNPALLFPFTYAPGVNGNGIKGEDNSAILYLNANDLKSATSFSIAFWMKNTAQAGRTEFLFSLVDDTYSGWHRSAVFLLLENQTATSTTMKFGLMDQWLEGTFNKPMFDGNWHHIVYSYDQTTSKMTYYFDGAVVTGMTPTQTDVKNGGNPRGAVNFSASSGFIIGGWNKHAGKAGPTDDWIKSYTGYLDQFRIYNKPLTPAEVQALYTNKQ